MTDKRYERKVADLNTLKLDVSNPNKMTDGQERALSKSMEKWDYVYPIVVDKNTLVIADGEHRLKELLRKGVKQEEVIFYPFKDDMERKLFRQTMNKLRGAHDDGLDYLELKSLIDGGNLTDLSSLIDESPTSLLRLLEKHENIGEDDFEPPREAKYKIERGDVYSCGEHRVMCGDATGAEDMAKLMAGQKADMVFTDPPYGVSIAAKNRLLNSVQKAGRCLVDIENDDASEEELYTTLVTAFGLVHAHMADNATYYITAPQGGSLGMMMMMMRDASLPVRHVLIWVKNAPTFSLGRLDYDYKHEPIFYGWKKTHNFYGMSDTSVWEIDKPRANKLHPTMKPIELIDRAITNSSKVGDIVLDPFGGSGSTLIACENRKRKCYMMEICPYYTSVILERFEKLTGTQAIKVT